MKKSTRRSLLAAAAVTLSGCSGVLTEPPNSEPVSTCDDPAGGWSQFQWDTTNSGRAPGPAVVPDSLGSVRPVDDRDGGAVLTDESLYFGSGETLYAYDAVDGIREWSKELEILRVTPAAYCDVILAPALNDVYALDASDGTVRWKSEVTGTTGAVAVVGETVVVPAHSRVHAFSVADGTDRWEFNPEWSIYGTCAVDGTIFVTGGSTTTGYVAAVDIESGEQLRYTRLAQTVYWPPTYGNGAVFVVDNGGIAHRIDADTGEIDWERPTVDSNAPTPMVTDSLVVVSSGNGDRTHALDRETGEPRWTLETGPVLAPPAAAGEEIYVGTMNRGLFAVDHGGTVQWHREEPNVGSPMAVHDGELVFKSRFPNPELYRLGS